MMANTEHQRTTPKRRTATDATPPRRRAAAGGTWGVRVMVGWRLLYQAVADSDARWVLLHRLGHSVVAAATTTQVSNRQQPQSLECHDDRLLSIDTARQRFSSLTDFNLLNLALRLVMQLCMKVSNLLELAFHLCKRNTFKPVCKSKYFLGYPPKINYFSGPGPGAIVH